MAQVCCLATSDCPASFLCQQGLSHGAQDIIPAPLIACAAVQSVVAGRAGKDRQKIVRLLGHARPPEHAQVGENGCLGIVVAARQAEGAVLPARVFAKGAHVKAPTQILSIRLSAVAAEILHA